MNILLSARRDEFWSDIINEISKKGINVSYWVGQVHCERPLPNNCFFHEVVDAYMLKNLYDAEKKIFDINLLSLDEYYMYLKILDRSDDIGGQSFSVRDRLLKDQLNYWYSVFSHNKPDAIVFGNVPHLVYDYPMYLVAKHLKIKTMIFNVIPFLGWRYLTYSIFSIDGETNLVSWRDDITDTKKEFMTQAVAPYTNASYTIPYYIKNQIKYDSRNKKLLQLKIAAKKTLIKSGLIEKPVDYALRTEWRKSFFSYTGENNPVMDLNYNMILMRFKKRLKAAYEKNVTPSDTIDKIEKYVYVPLHYQPEATTAPLGGLYSDQIYMLEQLRERLPKDVPILVKEHYTQFSDGFYGYRGRYLTYWDKMSAIDNLHIVPMSYSQKDLIINSLAVATVTGTAGWEAIQYGKCSIVFGESWYRGHPHEIDFKDLDDDTLNGILNGKELPDLTDEFLNTFCKSLVRTNFAIDTDKNTIQPSDEVAESITTFLNKEK